MTRFISSRTAACVGKALPTTIVALALFLAAASTAFAQSVSCPAIFPDGLQNSHTGGNAYVNFGWESRLVNSPDNILAVRNLYDNAGPTGSCDGTACTASGTAAASSNYTNFPGGANVFVGWNQTRTLAPGDYRSLSVGSSATLYLQPGTYTFSGNVDIGSGAQIIVASSGTARVFVAGRVDINSEAQVNAANGSSYLFLYARGAVEVGWRANLSAVMYGERDISLLSEATVTGAITSARGIALGSASTVTFDANAIASMDFGTFCAQPAPPPPPPTCSLMGGLHGDYFNNTSLTGTAAGSRVDGPIDFDWGQAPPGVAGVNADQFSVRWEGYIRAPVSGSYRFQTVSDDGVRLWVNGSLVIDNWTDHAVTTDTSGAVELAAGGIYPVRLEFYENLVEAVIRLRWEIPGGTFEPIPAGSTPTLDRGLYHCPPVPPAVLVREYRMDSPQWTGAANEVFDTSGNNLHGAAAGGAVTDDVAPAIAGDPGTCRYGEFDGVDDYLAVGGLSSTLSATASLAFWIRTTQTGNDSAWQAPGVTGVEEGGGTDDIFWGWLDSGGRIGLSVGNDFTTKSSVPINDGSWRHVVLTRDQNAGRYQIFINGSLDTSGAIATGVIGNGFSSIGRIEDTGGTHEYFQGQLDELKVYEGILTESEVQALWQQTHPCTAELCPGDTPQQGIRGEYYNSLDLSGTIVGRRADGPVDFNWGTGSPGVPDVNADVFSVGWSGHLRVTTSGSYQFQTVSDDGVRLWVNNVLVIDNWTDHSQTTDTSAGVELMAGQVYPIRLEFYENQTNAEIRLRWQVPGTTSFVPIPAGPLPTFGTGLYYCAMGIPDHYTVAVSATGVTCEAEPVTVTAYHADGTVMSPAAGTEITMTAAPALITTSWANGPTYIFSGTESSVTKALRQVEPATLNVGVTDTVAIEDFAPAVTFNKTGLIFYGDTAFNPIPHQVAGTTDLNTIIRAVETDTETGACIGRVEGTRSVNFAYECRNPTTCVAGQQLSLKGGSVQANNAGEPLAYSSVDVVFDAAGIASIPLNYSDVGQIRLHASLTLPAEGDHPEEILPGSSNEFVVKPHTLAVHAVPGNPGTTGTGAGFMAAGDAFSVQVEARNKSGMRTPNFGNEITPETDIAVDLANLVYPVGGSAGMLTSGGAFTPVAGNMGLHESSGFSWNEVGSVTLLPRLADGDYLAAGNIAATTESGTVGRFYPNEYVLVSSATSNGCGVFTYMGEPSIGVDYELQAQNSVGGVVSNYDNKTLSYLGTAAVSYVGENADSGSSLSGRVAIVGGDWQGGRLVVGDSTGLFDRQGNTLPGGPYDQLQLGLNLTDTLDSRTLANLDMHPGASGDCTADGSCTAKMLGGTLNLRFGRVSLKDAFGPETANLPVTFMTEYWDGNRWLMSAQDACTRIADTEIAYNGTNLATSNTVTVGGGSTQGDYVNYSGGFVHFLDGQAMNHFTAPGAGNTGSFSVDVSLANYPWLRFDWNKDGVFDDASLPSATFTFGSYRGHDRIIYWQEVLQ
jgi:hypothetical protein